MSSLQRIRLVLGMLALFCLIAGCGPTSSDSPDQPAERTLPAAYEMLGRTFGDLIISRDYQGAYAYIAQASRGDISYEEFEETFRTYRDRVEALKLTIAPGEPYQKDESDPLLPDAIRDRVEDEFAIHFEPEGDEEGFSANLWVLMEDDQPKIAHFFVGD